MPNRREGRLNSAAFLTAAWILATPPMAFANTAMGYIGLVYGQITRVQVANPLPNQSCKVQISLVDTSGQPVTTGETVPLAPGRSATLEVSGDAIATPERTKAGRTEVRPVITLFPPDPCQLKAVVSAEVVDINSVARVFYPPIPIFLPDPIFPPDAVHFGLIRIAIGEVARLTAVNLFPPESIKLRFRFLDAQSQVLSEQMVTVAPRASASVDFSGGGSAVQAEVAEIVPLGSSPHGVFATGEVFNARSGTTTVFYPPDSIAPTGGIASQ